MFVNLHSAILAQTFSLRKLQSQWGRYPSSSKQNALSLDAERNPNIQPRRAKVVTSFETCYFLSLFAYALAG